MKRIVQNLKKILLVLLCSSFFLIPLQKTDAVDSVLDLRDIVSSRTVMVTANHTISFTLSPNAARINDTDYIIISLPRFTGISVPTNITGIYVGSPQYLVIGTEIRITGILVQPGDSISIYGILADNPELDIDFYGNLKIGSYTGGMFNERVSVRFTPYVRPGYVLMKARIDRPVASVEIRGYAPPGMYITMVQSNDRSIILGTAVATWNGVVGEFMILIPAIEPADATHSFMLSGTDAEGNITPTIVVEEFLPLGTKVIISNLLMPPTIALTSNSAIEPENGVVNIARGDEVTVSGIAIPNSQLHISTEPPYQSFYTTTDSTGHYSYLFDSTMTSTMEFGDHKVNSFVTYEAKSLVSSFSFTKFFKVVEPENPDKPPCVISKGDLNCDEKVNLIDFSILLYFWGTTSVKADINSDKIVNLVDFSIMMFYWQG